MEAIIYARVSSVGQLKGHGIKRQIECCSNFAHRNNFVITNVFTECASGSDPSEMVVRDLAIKMAKQKNCTIFVEDYSRWSRSGAKDLPSNHGVNVFCCEDSDFISIGALCDILNKFANEKGEGK